MKICSIYFAVLLACCSFTTRAQVLNWRNLKPLVSTREVVETSLGTPSARFPFYDQFDDNVGEVHVWYSACSYTIKRGQSELMIPIGRLERLVYFPKKHAPFSEYAAETRDYKREDSPAVKGRFLYLSKNEEIMFETAFLASGEEVVMSIELSAPDLPPEAKCEQRPKQGQ
ncbi:MAG: hypothetical protein IPN69_09250 [Acidobacteria bacterium]|nr:hypothetical protein [Acidobacteriota bacterium]